MIYINPKKQAQIKADISEILNRANKEIIPRLRNINVEPTDCLVHWILQRHTDAVQHWVGMAKRPKIKDKLSRKFYEHMVKDDEAELFDYIEQQPAPTEEQKQYIGAIVYDKAMGRAVIAALPSIGTARTISVENIVRQSVSSYNGKEWTTLLNDVTADAERVDIPADSIALQFWNMSDRMWVERNNGHGYEFEGLGDNILVPSHYLRETDSLYVGEM